jgi:NADH dehydrogenase/putative oxidoreductase
LPVLPRPATSRLAPVLGAWDCFTATLAGISGPLDLAVRLWLAQIFFVSGILKTTNWDVTVFLYASEHPVPGLAAPTAAVIGTGIELICPVPLALGFTTRFAALPLLLTAAFLQFTYRDLADHLYWMALLGLLVVRGAGAISLDRLIAPHLAGSAVPFAAPMQRLAGWLGRYAEPPALLAARILLAWLTGSTLLGSASPMLKAVGLALCGLFGLGLATRPVALVMVILGLTLLAGNPALGDPVLRAFLFLGFVAGGAGALSLDHCAANAARRRLPSLNGDAGWLRGAPRVVIVGAGFGGIAAATRLKHTRAQVTVIDRRNYHLFQPLLYQVATAALSPAEIAVPIRSLLKGHHNARVLMGRVTGIDGERREVLMGEQRIPYDYLVLATGARHSYFGKDEWEAVAPGLKKIDDATGMRSRILAAFEKAEAANDESERRRLLTFVLVGGGPTGVELAGAIAELARQSLSAEFREIDPATARIILVQSGPRILPALPEALSLAATHSLSALGVEVMTNARVDAIDDRGVAIGEHRIEAATVLWTAGVMASPAGRWLGAERDGAGRIVVGPDLSVTGHTGVYAIGDTAACPGSDGRPLPGLAAVAKQQGHYVARQIRARIDGRTPPLPFRYRDYGSMATIGRKAAVADLPFLHLTGSLAWWLWGLVHLAFLVDVRSRIAVMFDWFWSYLTFNRSMRLITGSESHGD